MNVNEYVKIGQRVRVKWGKEWRYGTVSSVAGRGRDRNISVKYEDGHTVRERYYSVHIVREPEDET